MSADDKLDAHIASLIAQHRMTLAEAQAWATTSLLHHRTLVEFADTLLSQIERLQRVRLAATVAETER